MRQLYRITSIAIVATAILFTQKSIAQVTDSVIMGASYANDVYYSFQNGVISTANRSEWDIAFYTSVWSAGVLTNDGKGIVLKTYPKADTSGWNSVDTAGLSTWPAMYNSLDDWENGAFDRNAKGHPDYGWGVYNGINHNVVGDSIFIMKMANGSFKKFWLIKKISVANTYYFRYANLDGTSEVMDSLDCNPYISKNFVYYSMDNKAILDRDPESGSWDILFTKYMGIVQGTPYPVTGVFQNIDVPANRFAQVDPSFEDWFSAPMDSIKAPIGYDWKYFDNSSFTYYVVDSLVYFVMNRQMDVYKLVFNAFDYTVGKAVFTKSMVSAASVNEITSNNEFNLYPNPASVSVNLQIKGNQNWNNLIVSDMAGRVVFTTKLIGSESLNIPVDNIKPGVYVVSLLSDHTKSMQKLIITN